MTSTITDRVYGESASVAVKAPCLSVSVGPLPLSGLAAVGSYNPNPGDRILVKDQIDPTANGIYNASTGAWARSGDFDGIYDAVQGTLIVVFFPNGGALIYQLVTPNPIIGTTELNFESFVDPTQVYPPSQTEVTKGVTPSNTAYYYDDFRRYGAVLDGSTDCVNAVVQATTVGGFFRQRGPMALASASLNALNGGQGIELNSGTTWQSQPGWSITVTGTTPCNVFRTLDSSDVEFLDCYFIGNGIGTTTTGFLWYIQCTAGATKNSTNFKFIRGGAENFGGLYWIYVDNTAFTTFTYEKFLCDGSHFTSKPGNCQVAGLTTITTTAAVFGFSGSDTNLSLYSVKDIVVRNCVANGTYIKEFLFFWSGVLRGKAHDNILNGFGSDPSFSDDTACYALAAYDHSHGTGLAPHLIEFYNNTINVVRDAGIYHAAANQIDIWDNHISGQTSMANGTIPKGAIAGNSVLVTLNNNTITNCAIGVTTGQDPNANAFARANGNMIYNVPNNGIGMLISGSTGGNANDIGVNGLTVEGAGTNVTGLRVSGTTTVGINNLDIQNVDIHDVANGILLTAIGPTPVALGNVRFVNIKLRHCTVNCFTWSNANSANPRLLLKNITFADMVAGASGLVLTNSIGLTVDGVLFCDLTSGATLCWYGGGAQGRVSNVQYLNVAVGNRYDSSANRMGVDVPTWTGNDNDFVQDLNPNELIQVIAATNVKYTREGWVWDRVAAAWKEKRCLTGN